MKAVNKELQTTTTNDMPSKNCQQGTSTSQ